MRWETDRLRDIDNITLVRCCDIIRERRRTNRWNEARKTEGMKQERQKDTGTEPGIGLLVEVTVTIN